MVRAVVVGIWVRVLLGVVGLVGWWGEGLGGGLVGWMVGVVGRVGGEGCVEAHILVFGFCFLVVGGSNGQRDNCLDGY